VKRINAGTKHPLILEFVTGHALVQEQAAEGGAGHR